jgi:hypothetical protein
LFYIILYKLLLIFLASTDLAGIDDAQQINYLDHCQNRPAPPGYYFYNSFILFFFQDYNVFMAERCNSLHRNNLHTIKKTHTPLTFLNIPNFCLHDLYTHKFTWSDLEALIDIQEFVYIKISFYFYIN